ncbi:MAG: hypothetical protein IKC87_01275 [Clostridia bacterium]|nr:hypothetical protein [Clostridia bacterium]
MGEIIEYLQSLPLDALVYVVVQAVCYILGLLIAAFALVLFFCQVFDRGTSSFGGVITCVNSGLMSYIFIGASLWGIIIILRDIFSAIAAPDAPIFELFDSVINTWQVIFAPVEFLTDNRLISAIILLFVHIEPICTLIFHKRVVDRYDSEILGEAIVVNRALFLFLQIGLPIILLIMGNIVPELNYFEFAN